MKRSAYGGLVKLVKNYVTEERAWGADETIPARPKPAMSAAAPVHAAPAKHAGRTGGKQSPASAVRPVVAEPSADYGVPQNPALEKVHAEIKVCRKCRLGSTRLNAVPGTGNPSARLMFVGEGPGFEEDHRGEPFVGRAGQLLTKIIESIGLARSEVFITNIVKCHPMIDPTDPQKHGNDRPPAPDEAVTCMPYLERQVDIIKPRVICLLGSSATKTLMATEIGISKLRGRFVEYRGVMTMPTYHPAALLRNPALKKDVWEDMKKIRDILTGK